MLNLLLSLAFACPEGAPPAQRFSLLGWSPDSRRIAYATWSAEGPARVEVWDLAESRRVSALELPAPPDAVCPVQVGAWAGDRMCFPGLDGAQERLTTPEVEAWLGAQGVTPGVVHRWTVEEAAAQVADGVVTLEGPSSRRTVAVPPGLQISDNADLQAALPGAWSGMAVETLSAPDGTLAVVVRTRTIDAAYCHVELKDRMVFVR